MSLFAFGRTAYTLDPPSEPWCFPTHERAARAIAEGRTNPLASDLPPADDMSNESEQEILHYSCNTQETLEAALLPPSPDLPTLPPKKSGQGPSKNDGEDSIVVSLGTQVPRWDVYKQPGRQLQYFLDVAGFPSAERADQAAQAFQKAADEWNALNLGIKIVATEDQASASFNLRHWKPDDPKDFTLAVGFFPNEVGQDVWVYSTSFQPKYINRLPNIFAHEIGHILGLRHEFAITGDAIRGLKAEKEAAAQFMEPNYNSVMSYNFPPTIQQSDKDGIVAFYKLNDGDLIGNLPITDYVPQLRTS